MANVLYITAHPLDYERSYSLTVGKEFIDSYRALHPYDEIVHLDLYKEDIPYLDADVISGWDKLRAGESFEQLTSEEKIKVGRLAELGAQFILSDKYVFVTPMWNFSVPAIMKTYLDAVAVSGKTFKYSKQGSEGLLKGKKAIHIQASGDIYSEGPEAELEMGHRYLEIMIKFFGIDHLEHILIEGHLLFPEKAKAILDKALTEAKDAATRF